MSPPESNCNRDIYKQYQLTQNDTVSSNFVLPKISSSFPAAEWLKFRCITDNVTIFHQHNHGEISIGDKRVWVDGIVPKLNRVYQLYG